MSAAILDISLQTILGQLVGLPQQERGGRLLIAVGDASFLISRYHILRSKEVSLLRVGKINQAGMRFKPTFQPLWTVTEMVVNVFREATA